MVAKKQKNYCIDVMHTLLEGIVPLQLGCILYCLVTEKRLLTLSELNDRVRKFWGASKADRQTTMCCNVENVQT
jgi:hypothetical protein